MPAGPILRGLGLAAVWLAVSAVVGAGFFLDSDREVVVASHDTVISPTTDGWVVVRTGPVLPDLRVDSGRVLGVDVALGKTTATTTAELVERYALIASQPEGSIARVEAAVTDMAYDAALRGALVGLVPVAVWLLLGRARRRELRAGVLSVQGAAVVTAVALAVVLVWEPWSDDGESVGSEQTWLALPAYLGDAVPVPEAAAGVEIRSDPTAIDSRRLVESAVSTYQRSTEFYDAAAEDAAELDLRQPEEGETVAVLVSDRHDNIGMDRVARAIGDRAGAEVVLDAGDDTSTGQPWEAFSLDSVSEAFEGYDRFAVPGNHDSGDFVGDYLDDLGWTVLDGEATEGPGGGPLIGVADPRSSGLGNWRDETGLSFTEVGERFSEAVCDADERVATVLVHDVNLARQALADGCADLVVGGHVHVKIGPKRVEGSNGAAGYSFTTGTTGGAAYAIAIGSKPRRDAMVSLISYGEDGRPAGLQAVTLQTNGSFVVGEYVELELELALEEQG
ncbi:MAG: metallophosphoesterase [Nocardioides sp.]